MDRRSRIGFERRYTLRLVACVLLSVLIAPSIGRAAGEEKISILLKQDEVPPGCKLVDGTFATDLQTEILYDYSAYKGHLPVPRRKDHQSFECDGQKGTLFYFAYANEQEGRSMSSFARAVLWGEEHPTPMHPELVVDGGPFVVVVSFRLAPAGLVKALQTKISAGSTAGSVEKPSPASEEIEKGMAAYSAGNVAEAERHFRAATRLAPNDLHTFVYLGHFLYRSERFGDSIAPYERALELDNSRKVLDRKGRRILIDQLGMACGVSGKLDKAQAIFEEGIRQDPDYPLFHYSLACAHAEKGNLDGALTSLRSALERRDRVLPGESFPDPRGDSSFQKYLANDQFRKLLHEYGY